MERLHKEQLGFKKSKYYIIKVKYSWKSKSNIRGGLKRRDEEHDSMTNKIKEFRK